MTAERWGRRGATDAESSARGATRPARRGRAPGARARLRRGRDLPPWRRAGAGSRGDAGHDAARCARAAPARPSRPCSDRRRRRLSLPSPADPRRSLRRAPQGGPRRPARAVRRLARPARTRPRRARRDRRLPPRAGRPLPSGAREGPTPPSPTAPPSDSPSRADRAVDRQDYRTGAVLLGRAAELIRPHRTDVALELESAWAPASTCVRRSKRAEVGHANVPRPLVTIQGRCSRERGLLRRDAAGEPDATDELIALCRAALPARGRAG